MELSLEKKSRSLLRLEFMLLQHPKRQHELCNDILYLLHLLHNASSPLISFYRSFRRT